MPTLSSFVDGRIGELGLLNKEIAGAIHDALTEVADDVAFKTVEQKLSKLRNGDPEGCAFFLKSLARTAALATAIKSDVERLRTLAEHTTLVLDPRLPEEVIAYLQRRSDEGAAVACVSVPAADGPHGERAHADANTTTRETIRDEAKKHLRALVVTLNSGDDAFYLGAEIPTTSVQAHPRGFVLSALPDLVPLPPPPPPALWEGPEPRVPCAQLTSLILDARAKVRHGTRDRTGELSRLVDELRQTHPEICKAYRDAPSGQNYRETGALVEAAQVALGCHESGGEPTFTLGQLWPFLRAVNGCPRLCVLTQHDRQSHVESTDDVIWFSHVEDSECDPIKRIAETAVRHVLGCQGLPTVAWVHQQRIYAMGRLSDQLKSALAPHHAVESPTGLLELEAELRDLNPWRTSTRDALANLPEGSAWKRVRKQILTELGLDLTDAVPAWRRREDPEPADERNSRFDGLRSANQRERAEPALEPLRRASGEDEARTRATLVSWSAREFESERGHASVLFRLARASESPLVALAKDERDELHVLADVGGGHLLRIRARRFKESATPMRILSASPGLVIDGGDVRLWVQSSYDELLEGPGLRARARRREDDAAAADDDSDD